MAPARFRLEGTGRRQDPAGESLLEQGQDRTLDGCLEELDRFRQLWTRRSAFRTTNRDVGGIEELAGLKVD